MNSNKVQCPECCSISVKIKNELTKFTWMDAEFQAEIPVHICTNCGFQFTEDKAAEIQHNIIVEYLSKKLNKTTKEVNKFLNYKEML